MMFIALSVLSSVIIVLLFKAFGKWEIPVFPVIVVNYFVCVITGSISVGEFPIKAESLSEPWFPFALILGMLFVSGFYIVAITVQKFGITIASVLQKMAMIMSIIFTMLFYKESSHWMKILGIVLALLAVVLTNWPSKKEESGGNKSTFMMSLPALTFLTAGTIEIILAYVEKSVLGQSGDESFVVILFGTAGLLGLIALIIGLVAGKIKLTWKTLAAGIALGVPNYFSIYFLLRALGMENWDGSMVLPINNVAIILVAALAAFVLFKEKLSRINLIGVALACCSIVLIAWKIAT